MHAARLNALTKDFKTGFWRSRPVRALDGVTLDVEQGEALAYLGPNGAGKTTTLKLLLQLIFATSGSAEILGRPAGDVEVRRRVDLPAGRPPERIMPELVRRGARIVSLAPRRQTLEEFFVAHVAGRGAGRAA